MSAPLTARVVVELIGTFLLALTIQLMVLHAPDLAPEAPLAIALMLAALVYAGGPISAAMYNPAVALAVFVRQKLSLVEFALYVVAQWVGSFIGGGAFLFIGDERYPSGRLLSASARALPGVATLAS